MKFPSSPEGSSGRAEILLVQPPIEDFYLTRKRTVPYGLISIASVLRKAGFSVALFDALATEKRRPLALPRKMAYLRSVYPQPDLSPVGLFYQYYHFGYSFEHIGNVIRQIQPLIVGISSLFTPYADQALRTADIVKQYHPHCKIVMGGHHPTVMPRDVIARKSVDFVIRGQAEFSFLRLAQALLRGDELNGIAGLVYRSSDGRLHISEPVKKIDLEQLPPPAHDLVKTTFYRRFNSASLTISASRGCPMNCSYCSVGREGYLAYYRRSVAHVLAEIDAALADGPVAFVDIEDENLTMDKRWFLALLAGIRQRWRGKALELRAMNGLFPPSLDSEIIAAMKSAGFKTLNLSLGATSARQLNRFQRPDVRPAFDRALNLAQRQGLDAVGYVIAAGPYQDPSESIEDLLFLAQRRVLAGVSIFYPAPGSRDYQVCRELGLLPSEFSLMRSTALPVAHTTSRIEAITILRLGRILNFMKQLLDNGVALPQPSTSTKRIDTGRDRLAQGIRILSWFLNDGRIRGITAEGRIYTHRISLELTRKFIDGLKTIKLKGTI